MQMSSKALTLSMENQFFIRQVSMQLEDCHDLETLREMVVSLTQQNMVYKQLIKEGLKVL